MLVTNGMTRKEVIKTIGTPNLRSFDRNMEQWEYKQLNSSSSTIEFMMVYFEDGKVVRLESFSRPKLPEICPPGRMDASKISE